MIHKIARYFEVSQDYLTGKTDDPHIQELTETEIMDYQKLIEASRKKYELGNGDEYAGFKLTPRTLDLLESVLKGAKQIKDEEDD